MGIVIPSLKTIKGMLIPMKITLLTISIKITILCSRQIENRA